MRDVGDCIERVGPDSMWNITFVRPELYILPSQSRGSATIRCASKERRVSSLASISGAKLRDGTNAPSIMSTWT